MNPIRLLGILFILHAVGIAGFVAHRDSQKRVEETNQPTTGFIQGNLSVSTDPTGGHTSPGEVLKRYELSRISSRTIMLVIAAGLGIVGIICTATVSGRE
jgi:hypothetical protein